MKVQIRPSLFILVLLSAWLFVPSAVFAAEGGGDRWGLWLVFGRLFNLAILVGILVWVARKPLSEFLASRTQKIRDQLAEAQAARLEAETKLAEIASQMSRLDDELRELKATAERDAQGEYQRLLTEAERDAEKITESARREIDGMTKAAQMELKAYVANLSVQLAEDTIRREIRDEDRRRIFTRFVSNLGRQE